MMFDRLRPHAFREMRVSPSEAETVARGAMADAKRRMTRAPALEAYAVHLAKDRTRVITVEAWSDAQSYRADPDARTPGAALYAWAATGGIEPTPVDDPRAGVIVIDLFAIWRPFVGPVSKINIRNGEAFNREPGCISATVLRGLGTGRIATYARWRSEDAFAAAFAKLTGKTVQNSSDVNAAAAKMTFGLIRPDYHAYDLIAFEGKRP